MFCDLVPFLLMFHRREFSHTSGCKTWKLTIGIRKNGMGHVLLLSVLFIEKYQSGLT